MTIGARDSLEHLRAARISDRTRAELRAIFALDVADVALAHRELWPAIAAAVQADPFYLPPAEQSPEVRALLWTVTYLR